MVHISKGDYQNFKASVIDIIFWISSTPTPIPTLILVYSFWIYFSPPILGLGRQNINILTAVEISFSSVQFSCSVVSDSLQPRGLQHARPLCPSPTPGVYPNSCPLSWCCHPTISSSVSPSPPTFKLSQHQGLFKWVSSSHQVAKVLEFSFNISPSNEYSGLIYFRMDWLDLLAVQGTLKSRLQHHSSKASILRHSAFFIVQLSHPYMNTGKTIALSR